MARGVWGASWSLWLRSSSRFVFVESLVNLLAVGVLEGSMTILAVGVSGAMFRPKRCSDWDFVMSLGRPYFLVIEVALVGISQWSITDLHALWGFRCWYFRYRASKPCRFLYSARNIFEQWSGFVWCQVDLDNSGVGSVWRIIWFGLRFDSTES